MAALQLSGERFVAVYQVEAADAAEAEARAADIAVEQTVEFPADLVWRDDIRAHIFGRLEGLEPIADGRFELRLSFAVEVAGAELTQLLNVLFGNISIKPGIRLRTVELPAALLASFRGPRFGVAGLRARLGVADRPLLASALKPMGLSPAELATLATQFARGGIDLIKDDHGLADQPFCPFEERVARCAEAVARENEATGGRCLYLPNVSAPADRLVARARFAAQAGAGGLLVAPGLVGIDAMRALADDDTIGLPILSHPALQGSFVVADRHGLAHGALFGQIHRLAGADACIFPNYGGRFSFSPAACREVAAACVAPMEGVAPIFPVPAGGMRVDRVAEMVAFYGTDVMLLIGGDLHRHGDLVAGVVAFRRAAETATR